MKIRTRLTLIFFSIVALIMLGAAATIYYFESQHRVNDLYTHLINKSDNSLDLLTNVEDIDSNLLQTIDSSDAGLMPNEIILIYNEQFTKLYSSRDEVGITVDRKLFDDITKKKKIYFKQGDYEGIGMLMNEHKGRFIVVAAAIDTDGWKKLKSLRRELILAYAFCLILIMIAGRVFADRALIPLKKMIKNVDTIDYANLNKRLDDGNGTDEMAQLAQTFNNMLDRLETTFKVQRDFVANASHELRTPLTSITGQLEVMLMKERSEKEYKEALESVLDDIKNLSLTSNRLLMLAQATSKMTEFSFTHIRIDEILWQGQAELIKRKPDYKVDITFYDLPEDEMQLTIKGNDQLLKTMVTNLMENGCKYSDDQTVKVQLSVYRDLVQLIFSDQGIGINKEDLSHIFEPFYRSTNAITVKGHGLGLSLVQRIVNLHGGKIKVLSEPGVGSAFIITFPLAEAQQKA